MITDISIKIRLIVFILLSVSNMILLFMHIFDPDLSSQIAAYEAKNTIDGNYYDFGYYIRYIRQSCASYGNADNYKRIASDNFPHGFSVHPIWIAEH